ncbi:nitroreductase family deazaflavin-dependent oxidoreductase [Auraticoccus sp. F435]|uniref:Nitroreductase family deazaflavin-dependent oxidoreductase n=1 Tax=Auraticoccus cholistanensis TaxID=2656650 RepID=A0A6A9URV5_9ACTN|nr:nitroreductase family deazaflavin-dependent oxidoreductase [Auraticoccus cholistanensis]MVA75318.1 nitroreductase family deazaflavin-dependent oxidoreductase [Auraticoccus cholistanensis]
MSTEAEYEPSPDQWVRDQVAAIEEAGDTNAVQVMDRPVVLMTTRGAKSGKIRKVPVMRVEHEGTFLAVASKGGAPEHPQWYHNLVAHPEIELMVDRERWPAVARRIEGEERAEWWERAVAAYPPYADYQAGTDRQIPLFVLERR